MLTINKCNDYSDMIIQSISGKINPKQLIMILDFDNMEELDGPWNEDPMYLENFTNLESLTIITD